MSDPASSPPNDPLARIVGLDELSYEDRQPLLAFLEYAEAVFQQIDRGAGFCEDRGFGWGYEQERAEGVDRIYERLRAWPILRRLLPRIRHLRHLEQPVLGAYSTPLDDLRAARSLLTNTRSFTGSYGEEWGAKQVRAELRGDAIHVHEETFATALSGRPFDETDFSGDYSTDHTGRLWQRLRERFDADTMREISALAGRMGRAEFPCDKCGRNSQTLTLPATKLTFESPFAETEEAEIAAEQLDLLRPALAAHDMPAIRKLNRAWTHGYCPTCDANYCKQHLEWGQEGPEYLWVNPYARCPMGHCWDL